MRAFGFAGRGVIAIVGGTLVVFYMAVLFPAASLKSGSPQNRVVDLQRAHEVESFARVLEAWCATNDHAVAIMKRENIWRLDSSFPAIYGLTFAFLYSWLTRRRQPTRLDRLFFGLPLAAAVFDYIENVLELYALKDIDTLADVQTALASHTFNEQAILWQSVSAYVKYALLAASLAAIVVTLLARVFAAAWRQTNR